MWDFIEIVLNKNIVRAQTISKFTFIYICWKRRVAKKI